MNAFTYCVSTKVIFGRDAELEVGREIRADGGSHVLVLYGGGSAVKSGLLGRVTGVLEAEGLAYIVRGGVRPNPALSFIQDTLCEMAEVGIDFILAVGGGSVIDTAKAVAYGLVAPEVPVWDYFAGKSKPMAALPVGCVLTIPAAGSETSDSCVITNDALGEKRGLNTELNRPRFALMNPELAYTLPPYQTACGVTDILMHTLDRYFSDVDGNELTDALAETIMRSVIRSGTKVMEQPGDYSAQSELMWAGSLSHNNLTGLGRPKDFSLHQFGHELTGRYGIAHGASLSIMWPAWARAVCQTDYARFARLAREVWGVAEPEDRAAALSGIDASETFFRTLGLPVSLGESEAGVVSDEEIEALALGCSRNHGRSVGCFCPMDHGCIRAVYQRANL